MLTYSFKKTEMLIRDHVQDLVYTFLYTLYCIQSFLFEYVYISDVLWVSQIDPGCFTGCHFWRDKKKKAQIFSIAFFLMWNSVEVPTAPKRLEEWCLHWKLGTLNINLLFCFFNKCDDLEFIKWSGWISQWKVGWFIGFNTRWRLENLED